MLQIPDVSLTLPAYARGSNDSETYRVGRGEGVFEVARAAVEGAEPYVSAGLERAGGLLTSASDHLPLR